MRYAIKMPKLWENYKHRREKRQVGRKKWFERLLPLPEKETKYTGVSPHDHEEGQGVWR